MFTFQQKKNISTFLVAFFIAIVFLLTGCAGKNVVEIDNIEVSKADPYEDVNRSIFDFNKSMDEYITEPISDAYLWVTPQFVRTGVANFFNNLKDINVVLNDMMQGKIEQGAEDGGRFLVNTTVGLAGLLDVATEMGLEKHEEDFAQTLAVWGVPVGPYLVLPVLGPTTARGIPGAIFDTAANPASYVGIPVQLVQMLNARASAQGGLNFIDEAALDPYVFTRESFLQYREHMVSDGKSEINDDVLALEDDFYDDDELGESELGVARLETNKIEVKQGETPENETEEQVRPITHRLKLSSDATNFKDTSELFDTTAKSFDATSRSFEEVADKLDKMR